MLETIRFPTDIVIHAWPSSPQIRNEAPAAWRICCALAPSASQRHRLTTTAYVCVHPCIVQSHEGFALLAYDAQLHFQSKAACSVSNYTRGKSYIEWPVALSTGLLDHSFQSHYHSFAYIHSQHGQLPRPITCPFGAVELIQCSSRSS